MNQGPVVLVTEPIAEVGLSLLRKSCRLRIPWAQGRTFTDEDLRAADAIIVRLVAVGESMLSVAINLKVIGRHGIGLDSVDLAAATSRHIPVVFTPHAGTNAVAEHTVQLMLALARQILVADRAVRQFKFDLRYSLVGSELRAKVLGVVGLGGIGSRVAEICQRGFDMRIVAFDPYVIGSSPSITQVNSLSELLAQSDVVTLHLPLTSSTYHLINRETLAYMKPSAVLINTARGAVIDTLALADALKQGHLLGAAIDVFEEEPLPREHPLLSAPGTLFSPHTAGSTREALEAMSESVARQVLQVLRGQFPEFLANPDVFAKRRTKSGPEK